MSTVAAIGSVLKKSRVQKEMTLQASWIDTPLDPMLAIGDETGLYLLQFVGSRGLSQAIDKLCLKKKASIELRKTAPIELMEQELNAYFLGELIAFKTPLHIFGTPFQKSVWNELLNIPYGETRSYLEQAEAMNHKQAVRAVANANGANQFGIVIPCHRIINSSGALGGYGGGLHRKQWLLDHEKQTRNS